jgi:hypothetical protein
LTPALHLLSICACARQALWVSQWGSIYDEGSASFDLIHDIHDSYFLVNVVDNNFIDGDLFACFSDAVAGLMRSDGQRELEKARDLAT